MFFSYGPDEHPSRLVSSVTRALLTGNDTPCSEGSQRRDFLYSEDVAAAFVGLLDSAVEGPVNIASGEAVSMPLSFAQTHRLHDEVAWTPSVTLKAGLRRTVDWWRSQLGV